MPVQRGLRLSLTFIAIGAIASVVLMARLVADDDGAQAIPATTAEPAATSQPDWMLTASDACARVAEKRAKRTERFRRRAGEDLTPGQRVFLGRKILAPSFRRVVRELKVITVPAEQSGDFSRMLRRFRSAARELEADPWLIARNEQPKGLVAAVGIASDLGLEACSR